MFDEEYIDDDYLSIICKIHTSIAMTLPKVGTPLAESVMVKVRNDLKLCTRVIRAIFYKSSGNDILNSILIM